MLSTVIDAPVVLNIPPINIGASWRNFRLDFYKDKELTQPYNLLGLPLKSQINYPGTEIRYDVEINQGDTAKQLVFGLPYTVTAKLTPGLVNWDVFVADSGGIDVIAIGAILIELRATQWATGGTAAQPVVVPITGTLAEHEAKVNPHPQYQNPTAYQIPITSKGQTSFTLPVPVTDATKVGVYVNAARQRYAVDWTATSTVFTWISPDLTLDTTDKLEILI